MEERDDVERQPGDQHEAAQGTTMEVDNPAPANAVDTAVPPPAETGGPVVSPPAETMEVTVPTQENSAPQQGAQQVSPPGAVDSSSGTEPTTAPPGLVAPASAEPVDQLATILAFIREDSVLRTRLIEQLLEQNAEIASARTQGKE